MLVAGFSVGDGGRGRSSFILDAREHLSREEGGKERTKRSVRIDWIHL